MKSPDRYHLASVGHDYGHHVEATVGAEGDWMLYADHVAALESLRARAEKAERDAARAEVTRLENVIQLVVDRWGPRTPCTVCEGCAYEMNDVLRLLKEALVGNDSGRVERG